VLWEVDGGPVTLTAPDVAPVWSTAAASGEALWPAPTDVAGIADGTDGSGPEPTPAWPADGGSDPLPSTAVPVDGAGESFS
jgi:hypothetical protein